MFKVSVIIVSWNKKDLTLDTLNSLLESKTDKFNLEVVVVDNASSDGSVFAIRELFKKLKGKKNLTTKIIEKKENTGFVEGNNTGIQHAMSSGAKYVVLLNDDTQVDKEMIRRLVEFAEKNVDAGAVSPKIYFAPGYEFHKDRYKTKEKGKVIWYAGGTIDWANMYGTNYGVDEVDTGQFNTTRTIDFASGCSVLYPVKTLEKTGLFDEKYFAYLEDVDLSIRIRNKGYKIYFNPSAFMWHKVSQSSGIGSELNDYFITRNRLIAGFKYAGLRTKFALFRESIRFLLGGRKWQKIAVRDYYLGNFGKGSWGKNH